MIVTLQQILLIKRGQGSWKGYWSVPGGKVKWGESLLDATIRETREETGLEVEVGELAWVGEIIDPSTRPEFHYIVLDFWATPTGGRLSAGVEVEAVSWFDLDQCGQLDLPPSMRSLLANLPESQTEVL